MGAPGFAPRAKTKLLKLSLVCCANAGNAFLAEEALWLCQAPRPCCCCARRVQRLAAGFDPGGWSHGEEVWNCRSVAFAFMVGFLPRTAVQIKEIQP
ncbi:hypothetical protein BSK56_08720 [Paenibacillus borealis]|uniref:Secreted protein n=1 Tax=Paenibacillus borealis TaxID=160799 RepID=A0ABX3HGW5_PAEBO|nr:hypothetical protein BSK56_08720 [Paenibacillus borealis]